MLSLLKELSTPVPKVVGWLVFLILAMVLFAMGVVDVVREEIVVGGVWVIIGLIVGVWSILQLHKFARKEGMFFGTFPDKT